MEIDSEERQILELFCKRAKEIADSSIFREKKYNISLNVDYKMDEEVKFTETAPEKEALISLITILRQFYAQGNSIFFNRVYNIVWKYLDSKSQEVKECAISALESFKKIQRETLLCIKIGEHQLKPKEIIDLWFNANIFHADINKVIKFEKLSRSPVAPIVAFEFKSAIINLSTVVLYFSSFIKVELLNN